MAFAAHAAAIGLVALVASQAMAQQPVAIPADVETVVTGGKWRTGNSEGTFRIVVRTGGFEHIVSQVQVDWIALSADRDKSEHVVSSKIAETGSWRILRSRIVHRSGQWHALLEAIETHLNPAPRGTWEIALGPPGALKTTLRQK